MKEINRDELKQRLDYHEKFKLVMVADKDSFNTKHIPFSINASGIQEGLSQIEKMDDIVLYGCNEDCSATKAAVFLLDKMGFEKVSYYAGGMTDWESAGYQVERHTK